MDTHNIIKELRERKKLSQEYLANKLKISQPAYAQIESGQTKLSVDKLEKIAEILGSTVEDILKQKNNAEGISIAYNKFSDNSQINNNVIQHYHTAQVTALEKFISHLQSENEFLRSQIINKS